MGSRGRHSELPDLYRLTRTVLMAHDSAKTLPFGILSKRWPSVVGIFSIFLSFLLTSMGFRHARDWSGRVDRYKFFRLWPRTDRNEHR